MSDLENPNYKPGKLLDRAAEKLSARNDAQLAAKLEIDRGRISKFRHSKLEIPDGVMVRLNEFTGIALGDMRELMGLPRRKYIHG